LIITLEASKSRSCGARHRILILASAVFHHPGVQANSAGIPDAYSILSDIVGRGEKFRNSRTTVYSFLGQVPRPFSL
jgi:hypothetical protein